MDPTTLIPVLAVAILALSSLIWAYSVFFKPYYLLVLSHEAKKTASELWWDAFRCADKETADRIFAVSEEIDNYGGYIQELRFSPNELEQCMQKINRLDKIRSNKQQYRSWYEKQADLGHAYMVFFMLVSFMIRHPFAVFFVIVNASVFRFFLHYWNAMKTKIVEDSRRSVLSSVARP